MNKDGKREDLETYSILENTPVDEEHKSLVLMKREMRKMESKLNKLSKIQTPFGTVLHYPLIFISVAFFTLIIVGYFTHKYMNKIDMDYFNLRQEFKDDLERERNEIIHYIDNSVVLINKK